MLTVPTLLNISSAICLLGFESLLNSSVLINSSNSISIEQQSLPSNLQVSLRPQFKYSVYEFEYLTFGSYW